MIYTIRHKTTYTYGTAVKYARCMLRLTPRSTPGQTVLTSSVEVTPRPSRQIGRVGPFDEDCLAVVVDAPHRVLTIEARSRVDVHVPPLPATKGPAWEEVRADAYASRSIAAESPASFLFPTQRTPVLPAITDYARLSFTAGRPVMTAVMELTTRIHADFRYDSRATDVSTPAAEAFKGRRGVCQDFAHIMIAGLRGLGLPAAYVSGYLRTIPPPGKPRLEGADATHAWVSVWCGEEVGWIGFDPTNAILARDDHIVLAVGRDYSDVAPIDGIILAPGKQKLKVGVDVVPEGEEAPVPAAKGRRAAG